MSIYTLKHGVATFTTGAVTKAVALSPGAGNFSISEVQAGNVSALPVMNRGTFQELVEGPEVPVEFTISLYHDGVLTAAGSPTVWDAILGTGNYAGETSDDPGTIVWTGIVTLVSTRDGAVQTHTLLNVRLRGGYTEGEGGNEITVSGTAYGNGSGDAYAATSA